MLFILFYNTLTSVCFFLKLFVSSPIALLPPTSCSKGQWITIPYVTPYQLSTYHILTYPSLVIPLFSMTKCYSLFNSPHTSDHLCCPYLCLFYSISSFPRWNNKNAVLCSRCEKHHYLYTGVPFSVLLTVPLLTVSHSLCAFLDYVWALTGSCSCMMTTHSNAITEDTLHLLIYFVWKSFTNKKKNKLNQTNKIEERTVLFPCWTENTIVLSKLNNWRKWVPDSFQKNN